MHGVLICGDSGDSADHLDKVTPMLTEVLSDVFWANIFSAIPPTILALGAFIASIRGRKTAERVEEKVNGSLDTMMTKLSENIKLVSDTKRALETSISSHEAQIEVLKKQLETANEHIHKLIMVPDQLEKVLLKHQSEVGAAA